MISIMKYGEISNSEIFARQSRIADTEAIVAEIISNVRQNGDKAVLDYTVKFDKVVLDNMEVTQEEIDQAFAAVDPEFLDILRKAAAGLAERTITENWAFPPY